VLALDSSCNKIWQSKFATKQRNTYGSLFMVAFSIIDLRWTFENSNNTNLTTVGNWVYQVLLSLMYATLMSLKFLCACTCTSNRVATGKEMVGEKNILQGQGKVREIYFESRKLTIWRKVRENLYNLTQLI